MIFVFVVSFKIVTITGLSGLSSEPVFRAKSYNINVSVWYALLYFLNETIDYSI